MQKHRVNAQIWAKEVRVVGPEGEDFGILTIEDALAKAKELKMDLVEVAAKAQPPVTKIMNYGKFKFEQEKREREARKKQKAISLKEVKLRPKIGDHDREFKIGHGIQFLQEGNKLKVTVMFTGREMAHTELGRELLKEVTKDLDVWGKVESTPRLEGRNMSMIVSPRQGVGQKLTAEEVRKLDPNVQDEEAEEETAEAPESAEDTQAAEASSGDEATSGDDGDTSNDSEDTAKDDEAAEADESEATDSTSEDDDEGEDDAEGDDSDSKS